MGNPTSLSDYINRKHDLEPTCAFCGRQHHVTAASRKPAWLRRMEQQGLPNQDRTSYILGSFTPKNDGGAA